MLKDKVSSAWAVGSSHAFINPFSYLQLRKSPKVLSYFDRVLVDGQSLVLFFRLMGVSNCNRKSFDMTSVAPEVFDWLSERRGKVYIVGTKPELVQRSIDNFLASHAGMDVVGFSHGYLDEAEKVAVQNEIVEKGAEFVIVGMGTPLQEVFLSELIEMGWEGTSFTCGGFLHQSASSTTYYPDWVDRYHFRWLYRVFDEPKLAKRYSIQYPLAYAFLVVDVVFSRGLFSKSQG